MTDGPKALIITVGLQKDPISLAIKHHQPHFIAFIATPDSRKTLDDVCSENNLKPSNYQILEVEDNPGKLGNVIREAFRAWQWVKNKGVREEHIIYDPTPGRKWMSTGLTMFATLKGKNISYVDVRYQNGQIVPGTEQLINLGNPEDQTGFLKAHSAIQLFNQGLYDSAKKAFESAHSEDSAEEELYNGMALLADTMHRWDLFEHYKTSLMKDWDRSRRELRRSASSRNIPTEWIDQFHDFFQTIEEKITNAPKPCYPALIDLFLNAERKIKTGNLDDAVARLYRCLEATAEYILHTFYEITPASMDWDKVPSQARERFCQLTRANPNNLPDILGLKNQWDLLSALHDRRASLFDQSLLGLLTARNESILAHGWEPIHLNTANRFLQKINDLLKEIDPPQYEELELKLTPPQVPDLWSP
ncbi:MAG: TIGR02710 family CRISPR-associated protein [Fimbriimonadales bacterium]|nr:TIGR02710 family CRISPR-associated protein [Fimbriimonadales bacterium]